MEPAYNKLNSFGNILIRENTLQNRADNSSEGELSTNEYYGEDIYSNEIDAEDFDLLVQEADEKFCKLKKTYSTCFEHAGIKKAPQGKTYPPMIDVDMDFIKVKSTIKHQYLGTTGVGVCIAVMARGITSTDETWIALSHSCTQTPKEVLTKIQKKLQSNGCKPDTIEFFLVGGQLPYWDGSGAEDFVDMQVEFLSYAKEFNIVGAQFNLASGAESLSIIISKDEIVWATELVNPNEKHLLAINLKRKLLVTSFEKDEEQNKKARLDQIDLT